MLFIQVRTTTKQTKTKTNGKGQNEIIQNEIKSYTNIYRIKYTEIKQIKIIRLTAIQTHNKLLQR